jgi:nitrogenase iron protein NifH
MRTLAIYGKGGIGKSTVAATLAVLFAQSGRRVLLIGCDPKHDTSYKVVERSAVRTVMGALQRRRDERVSLDDILMSGRVAGLDCIETGGPEPGVGCAGRGITRMFELIAQLGLPGDKYDVVIYDVLGDVVCGGFAAPIRGGHAREVYIVASGEIMALYAANNICRAVMNNRRTGVRVGGLVANLRNVRNEEQVLATFTSAVNIRLLPRIPRDPLIGQAEAALRTIVEHAPDSDTAACCRSMFAAIDSGGPDDWTEPTPLDDDGFDELVRAIPGP